VDWQRGQSSSVRAGLDAAQRLVPQLEAAVFLLADMPDVQAATVDALVEANRASLAPVVVPRYQGGTRGNPVLFDRDTFAELRALEGDVGGRPLIERHGDAVRYVAVDQPLPQGLDTPEAYHARRSRP
jgi:molybdenum cofactor cytidylyltransferase